MARPHRTRCNIAALLLASASAMAQTFAADAHKPHLKFDIASVREVRGNDPRGSSFDTSSSSSFWHCEGISLWGLILTAYGIRPAFLLTNVPDWAMSTKYDITAKSDASADEYLARLSKDDLQAEKQHMLQQLLAERFGLRIHEETRTSTVYELSSVKQAKDRITPVKRDANSWKLISSCNQHFSKRGIEVASKGCPFQFVIGTAQQELQATVINKTAFSSSDLYAYHLMWDRHTTPSQDDTDLYPPIRQALRDQLGLELRAGKGPVTYWL